MKLYHGTNEFFERIDLSRGAPYKDFGKGFYLTPNVQTAVRMAKKRSWLEGGDSILLTYEFDETALTNPAIHIKEFSLSKEWVEFVNKNRNNSLNGKQHAYDIVIGPIANDGVAYLLGRWNEGTMPLAEILEQLRGRFLDTQYYFGSECALDFLKMIKSETL